jgi:hypothetical protein
MARLSPLSGALSAPRGLLTTCAPPVVGDIVTIAFGNASRNRAAAAAVLPTRLSISAEEPRPKSRDALGLQLSGDAKIEIGRQAGQVLVSCPVFSTQGSVWRDGRHQQAQRHTEPFRQLSGI